MTQVRLQFNDFHGVTLAEVTTDTSRANVPIDAEVALRVQCVHVTVAETPDAALLMGTPDAISEYRRSQFRQLANDQFRRGLDPFGSWDFSVPRCGATSPEGGSCSLRKGHEHSYDGMAPGEVHERIPQTHRPRQVAEVWPAHTEGRPTSSIYAQAGPGSARPTDRDTN